MSSAHLVRMVFAAWLPASVTPADVTAVMKQELVAARVDVYPPPTLFTTPPRCAPHAENAMAFTNGAWRCPRCVAEGAGDD
ncbi:MAG: hypothetical protein Q7K37_04590 [Dehalococcoidia bacterium]|nr:hypothetical protein [Dehalococcoidia bacterium]